MGKIETYQKTLKEIITETFVSSCDICGVKCAPLTIKQYGEIKYDYLCEKHLLQEMRKLKLEEIGNIEKWT